MAEPISDVAMEEAQGWGDDDELELDPDEKKPDTAAAGGDGEAGWDVEDEGLEIPDLGPTATAEVEGNFVHLPTPGPSPPLTWTKNSQLVADHVAAGSFESAARLLHDQLGVVDFKPFESLFLNLYSTSKTVSSWQQNVPPSFSYPLRNWKEANIKNQLPASGVKLNDLVAKLQICYQLTTGGKFTEAIEKLQTLLLSVSLLVVDNKQEITEAQQLLRIASEYICGLQMETLRKTMPKTSPEEQKRQCEMAAYFTHCKLQVCKINCMKVERGFVKF